MDYNSENQKNDNKRLKTLLIIIAILMIIFGSVSFGYYLYTKYYPVPEIENTTVATTVENVSGATVKNPIDFKTLQKGNDEIYAWLKVPGTDVDYPVCQSKVDDRFYLRHRAEDKQWLSSGAIYTEMWNKRNFNDRVTLIYGHNGYKNASMFTTLHRFEKKDFFDSHEYFYIYTPDSKLTYRIISAFKYDDRHIMVSFDFQDNAVYADFLKMIQNPESSNKNVRSNDKELTTDDNIVVLSTCITNQKSNRYLICGVLVNNEKTN